MWSNFTGKYILSPCVGSNTVPVCKSAVIIPEAADTVPGVVQYSAIHKNEIQTIKITDHRIELKIPFPSGGNSAQIKTGWLYGRCTAGMIINSRLLCVLYRTEHIYDSSGRRLAETSTFIYYYYSDFSSTLVQAHRCGR